MTPWLVLAIGNPSRGDDALGPAFAAALSDPEVEVVVDFQLQVEHTLDLRGRAGVVIVDASATAPPPCALARVAPDPAGAPFTHALSPAQLLAAAAAFGPPPPTWVLAIRGERFALGDGLSAAARGHLAAALDRFTSFRRGEDHELSRAFSFEGVVQGVGFRPHLWRRATARGLVGRAWNGPRGAVAAVRGPAAAVWGFLGDVVAEAPPGARIEAVTVAPAEVADAGFAVIEPDADAGGARLSLRPDVGVCDDCLAEVRGDGPLAGWPLASCAACGPRYAIATGLPWSRARTTLAAWPDCPACAARHADPADRRFGAEGVTCPRCGPQVAFGDQAGPGALDAAVACLRAGGVIAVHGLGAVHLACDAANDDAVRRIRARKRRETRPFALLVATEDEARALVELDEEARAALRGPERPIVVAPARPGAALAPAVAPGTGRLGVQLPCTPLHAALAAGVGRPLVLTSANPTGAPPAIDPDALAADVAAGIDGALRHPRRIARRSEDSVVLAAPGRPRVVRRARGFAPAAFRLPVAAPAPILALGGHDKTAPCLVIDDTAFLAPHLGDLDTVEAEQAFLAEVEGFERLLGVRAEVVAHDLHPAYATTRLAAARGGRRVGVQHHAAHAFAALAESGLAEPAVALVIDGTGWGPDGTAWGAEVLLVDEGAWTRLATARPLPLPGGERAIRQVWRQGLAALRDALGDAADPEDFPGITAAPADDRAGVDRMLATGVGCVPVRGLGRWFDALGCLVLGRSRADHEAQVALALEEAAGTAPAEPWPLPLPPPGDPTLDLRPLVRALVADRAAGAPPSLLAARAHETLAAAFAALLERALLETGARRVLVTGGASANLRLSASLARRFPGRLWLPAAVPAHDGGLALGQAWAAAFATAGRGS